jgi:hypothetical protein
MLKAGVRTDLEDVGDGRRVGEDELLQAVQKVLAVPRRDEPGEEGESWCVCTDAAEREKRQTNKRTRAC